MQRPAICLVLATSLVTTPLKLALAQAAQQDAATVQQTTTQDSSRTAGLLRVPPVTERTARLLHPSASEDTLADIFGEDGSLAGPASIPKGAKIVIYIVGGLALALALFLYICSTSGCLFGSPAGSFGG